jgi:HK97 family phage major capsid protein
MSYFDEERETFERLQREAIAVLRHAESENRDLSPEEKSANDDRYAAMKSIQSREVFDRLSAQRAIFAAADNGATSGTVETPHGTVTFPQSAPGRAEYERNLQDTGSCHPSQFGGGTGETARKQQFAQALREFAATGDTSKFATVTTVSGGGILLPRDVATPLQVIDANAFRIAIAAVGSQVIFTPLAADLRIPILDQAAGSVVSETATVETSNDPLPASITLTAKMYQSGSAWFSNLTLQGLDYNMEQSIIPELNHSREMALEGSIVSAIIADAALASVLLPTTTTVSYAAMLNLIRAVPRRFARQLAIVINSEVFGALEKLVDTTGRPILNMDPANSEVLRFNGTPLVRSDFFETFGSSKTVGCVMSGLGFKLRDAGQPAIARYANIPTRPSQTGFNAFGAHGFGWSPTAVVKLKTPV